VSTGIGPLFLQSPDVLASAAGPFPHILATFSFLTATCDLFCFLLTGVFFFGADLVSDFCLSTSLVLWWFKLGFLFSFYVGFFLAKIVKIFLLS
jgi:hypothetical protein